MYKRHYAWKWWRGGVILAPARIHDDVIRWKHFPRYWPFVRPPVMSPSQRPVTRSFDAFFDLHLNERLSKQSRHWWFEMPSSSSWRYCNVCPRLLEFLHKRCIFGGFPAKMHLCAFIMSERLKHPCPPLVSDIFGQNVFFCRITTESV